MRGRFIVFEGIDGSGKTTQILRVKNYLESSGFEVIVVREPGGTPEGEEIRRILLSGEYSLTSPAELFLFLASRSVLVEKVIKPALEEGKIVIADRFTFSSEAYQGYGRGIDLDFIRTANRLATGDLVPDLVLYIDLPVEDALARKRKTDRMEEKTFLDKVRNGYLKMAKEYGFVVINGMGSEEDVWKRIERVLNRFFGGGNREWR